MDWKSRVAAVVVVFIVFNLLGAFLLQLSEPFSYTDAFYLSMSASTTSGYGNVAPSTDAGKWLLSFYQLVGIGLFFYMLAIITVKDLPV